MKAAILSLGLIALGIIVLLSLPPLREEARTVTTLVLRGGLTPSPAEVRQAVKALPPRPALEIASAQFAMYKELQKAQKENEGPQSLPSNLSDFEQAAEDFPNAPEAHFHLGLQQLLRAGNMQRPDMWRGVGAPVPTFVPPQMQEAAFLGAAIEQFRLASALAPKNSAPDYLLATALFYQGSYTEAEASLRTALTKPEWSLYNQENRLALLELYRRCRVPEFYQPLVVPNIGPAVSNAVYSRVDFLSRMLLGLMQKARAEGQEQRALFFMQALLHLDNAILDGADTVDDGSAGGALLALPREPFISREQIVVLQKQYAQQPEQLPKIIATLQESNLKTFLTNPGRTDLVALYEKNQKRVAAFQSAAAVASRQSFLQMAQAFSRPFIILSTVSLFQFGYGLGLLLLSLLLSLVFWASRGPGKAPVWRSWEWGLLMVLSFLPLYAVMLFYFPPGERTFVALTQNQMAQNQRLILKITVLAALLLPLLAPLVGGLLKRPESEKERIGKLHACLVSWRTLLLPAVAVLFLVTLGLGYFAHQQIQPWVKLQNKIMQQGVVKYYKLLPPQ